MDKYTAECVEGTKELLKSDRYLNEGKNFNIYSRFYIHTNENINGYLNMIDLSKIDSSLSVMGSGDHIFNLISNDIMNIDTFDINKLSEYFALGIKKSIILKYSYQDFLYIIKKLYDKNTPKEEICEIVLGLLPYMDLKYKQFWNEILNYYFNNPMVFDLNNNLFGLLCFSSKNDSSIIKNNYLQNEENYNALKNRISSANISFKCCDAINLPQVFNKKYDCILLSNILDYFYHIWGFSWQYSNLKEYEKALEKICNPNSLLFLNYVFVISRRLFVYSDLKEEDLTDEKIITFPSIVYPFAEDAMILKRVNK